MPESAGQRTRRDLVGSASPLRLRALVILAAVVALLSLLLFANIPGKGLWHQALLIASHGPLFLVIAVLLMLLQPPRCGRAAGRT